MDFYINILVILSFSGIWVQGAITKIVLADVQPSNFTCAGRSSGYYADLETGCQTYHFCDGGNNQYSYTCPNSTLFQQRMLICAHSYTVDCKSSERDYSANLLIGQRDKFFVGAGEFTTTRSVGTSTTKPLPLGQTFGEVTQRRFSLPNRSTTPFYFTSPKSSIPNWPTVPPRLLVPGTNSPYNIRPTTRSPTIITTTIRPATIFPTTPTRPTTFTSTETPVVQQNTEIRTTFVQNELSPPELKLTERKPKELNRFQVSNDKEVIRLRLEDFRKRFFIADVDQQGYDDDGDLRSSQYFITLNLTEADSRMQFRDPRGQSQKASGAECASYCDVRFLQPGTCHPCIMIK